jgi:hypothetical protein
VKELKVIDKVMKVETAHGASIKEILHSYSGRRLQYAIRIGILPTPESLKQLLKRKTSAENVIKNRAMA